MRAGYILQAALVTSGHYFQSAVRGELVVVSDPDHAWFTESLDAASSVLIDLFSLRHGEFRIVPHTHNH